MPFGQDLRGRSAVVGDLSLCSGWYLPYEQLMWIAPFSWVFLFGSSGVFHDTCFGGGIKPI